jgi:hypothetical protein
MSVHRQDKPMLIKLHVLRENPDGGRQYEPIKFDVHAGDLVHLHFYGML